MFLKNCGFLKAEGTIAMIRWRDAGQPQETGRSMQLRFAGRGR
jgi:hypothetical protein